MPLSPLDAYRVAQKAAPSGRELEASLLFRSATQLEAVERSWDSPDRPARLSEALRYNTRLWSVFQASLEDPEHNLPQDLRVNLIQLIRFIDQRTVEILSAPRPDKLRTLVEINRQIGMGLSTSVPAAGGEKVVGPLKAEAA